MSGERTTSTRRTRKSERQQRSDENKADAAAKTAQRKQKNTEAAAKKARRAVNNAQAAALQDATNTRPEQSALSSEEKIAALENRVEALSRKNKRLSKALRRNEPTTNDEDITAIPKPKERKFNIKSAMGLEDNQRLFTELQALIRTVAIEAKIDFDLPWKDQEPSDVAKVLRVAAGRNSYLSAKRFPRHWATSAILQRYINSVRGYNAGKANPTSGVNRRRQRNTTVGRLELMRRRGVEARRETPPPRNAVGGGENSNVARNEGQSRAQNHNNAEGEEELGDENDDDDSDDEDMTPEDEFGDEDNDSSSGSDENELPMAQD
ncbi:hypothetical protein R3P38DRAFT_3576054 [Favolaschia claudopus]|uniref:Uncharacterized protein n=1 Tax=Favolaschia claudopus TaxID=2862362 RepID=A0AAW0AL60_9AGAR